MLVFDLNITKIEKVNLFSKSQSTKNGGIGIVFLKVRSMCNKDNQLLPPLNCRFDHIYLELDCLAYSFEIVSH